MKEVIEGVPVRKAKKTKKTFLLLAAGLIFFLALGFWQWRWLIRTSLSQISPLGSLQSAEGRVNILILGIGGKDHPAGDLTDTMILASARLDGSDVVLATLPRDLWVPSLRAKLNTVYHYQEAVTREEKLEDTKGIFGEILGLPIHYQVMIDFQGFVELINLVGGVEIKVERSFDDHYFPIPGLENAYPEESRYEDLHFDAGLQLMDGERALKYVRSRNAEGEEGTDFARSRRQLQLIAAIRQQVVSTKTLFNFRRIFKMANIYRHYVFTDIGPEEYVAFVQLFLETDHQPMRFYSLDEGNQEKPGCLVHTSQDPRYDYQWVLVPRSGDWDQVHFCLEEVLRFSSAS